MSKPIPRKLLIHSAIHNYSTTKDDWGNETWGDTEALTFVRFEPSTKLVKTKDNREIQLSAIMFFDCRNSRPLSVDFAVGDQIIQTGGATYTIEVVDFLNDEYGEHHYEVGLC
jgi:hypothetical protein